MRKHLKPASTAARPAESAWLDLEPLATVEVSSEDTRHPIEDALVPTSGRGWRAATRGPQTIRLLFEEPQRLRRIHLAFSEPAATRTQEFVLRWQAAGDEESRDIVRQRWNFSPQGSTREVEDYAVDLAGVAALELTIEPDVSGGDAVASLMRWRLA